MLANISEADDYEGEIRPLPDEAPVRRIGLEQEFFVVDRKGEPRDLADLLLRECREAGREGLDPALVALTRACPFYEGRLDGFAARTVHYRGILGFDGLYTGLGR
jgi:gamma-glutamyl:cysteine ligase YbdK (ATP-grasp superfamily)